MLFYLVTEKPCGKYSNKAIFIILPLQRAVLQDHGSHSGHSPLWLPGVQPDPGQAACAAHGSCGDGEDVRGTESAPETRPQDLQHPDYQHVCSGMSETKGKLSPGGST